MKAVLIYGPVDVTTMAPLQQIIESQFSLEILLKHNELRLIDQELAKCQIALEQLRRCELIPFPASSTVLEDLQATSQGSGPVLKPKEGTHAAPYPAPWGVVDGPYSRHYSRWLIPDSAFDGSAIENAQPRQTSGKKMPERTTRGGGVEKAPLASKSRSQRGSTASRLQALPAGYPEPKEDKGPMILKRSTDGQMVKLVCLDCRRDNFNSAQGFINHCRIAHNRGFASHDAAAIACGEEIEVDEAGTVVGDQTANSSASVGLVHPLIRSAHTIKPLPALSNAATPRRRTAAMNTSTNNSKDNAKLETTHAVSPSGLITPQSADSTPKPFTPSLQTPHLSALFARRGLGGDLIQLVEEATTKMDVDAEFPSEDEEDDRDEETPQPQDSHRLGTRGGRLPTRATMSPAPLNSPADNKTSDKPPRRAGYLNNIMARTTYSSPYTSSIAPSHHQHHQQHPPNPSNIATLDASTPLNLSPNTIESNPAPSLTSDDGDYENIHSDSEAPSTHSIDDEDDRYLDIEVEADEEEAGRGGPSSVDPDLATAHAAKVHPTAAPTTPSRRSSALRHPADGSARHRPDERERHVSFASPVKKERRTRSGK